MALATIVLVIGIRESASTNALLVFIKVGVVLFVIGVGCWYVNPAHWTRIPPDYRKPTDVPDLIERYPEIAALLPKGDYRSVNGEELLARRPQAAQVMAAAIIEQI